MTRERNQQIQEKAQIASMFVVITQSVIQIVSAVANLATLFRKDK